MFENDKCVAKTQNNQNYNTVENTDVHNTEINQSNKKIDVFFDEIGYTRYQYFLLFVFIFVFFADGTEVLVITLILKSLENEWKITSLEKSILASSAFVGLLIGSLLTAKYIDKYGRKIFLSLGGCTVILFGFLCSFSNDVTQLFFLRVLTGIGIGSQIPAATNLAAESKYYFIIKDIPSYNRSIFLANIWIAFPVGELYICLVGMYIMPNFEINQWRILLLYCLIPVIICTIFSFFVMESGRFLLTNGKYEDARLVFEKLAKYGGIQFNNEKMEEIIDESIKNPVNKYESSFSSLFDKRFLKLSILTWVIWFVGSFCLYGTIYMLPQILDTVSELHATQQGNMFKDIIISNLISLPKTLLSGFLSNIPCLGRKYSLCYSFVMVVILEIFLIFDLKHVHIYSGFIKLLAGLNMGIIKVYSTEAYPTKIRGMGYGTGHSISRLAGCIIPFACELARSLFGILGPCYCIFVLSSFSAFCCHLLPFETLGRVLDKVDDSVELTDKECKIIIS